MIDLNILDILFLYLTFSIISVGILVKNYENHLPAFVLKAYRYGSFAYQGSGGSFLKVVEMPKAYYRHFYLFSSVFSVSSLVFMILVYVFGYSVNGYISLALRILLQQDEPSVPVASALLAMMLLTIQCLRRFYETYCLQVFAKSSKMNLSHYLVGIFHYFGCILTIIGQAPMFTGTQSRDKVVWNNNFVTLLAVPCTILYLWAWYEQYQSNLIFAHLRRDKKSGEITTEDHGIPHGRLFEHVSSPHRLCELIMYTMLLVLVPTRTFLCIYSWVISNQFQTAILAHDWYQKTFKAYPKNRMAICPYLL